MKKRLIPFMLAAVMLFSVAATSYSADSPYLDGYEYVLPKEYYDYPKFEWELEHGLAYLPGSVTDAANLWYRYEGHENGEAWPQEYLEVYEEYMDAAELGSEGFTLYGYEWKRGKLFVDFGATFDVKYYWRTGNSYTELYGPTSDDYKGLINALAVALTDKNDGGLVRMINSGDTFIPELRYNEYNTYHTTAWQFLSPDEAKAFEESKGMELEYTAECRKTVEISLPDDFDPELYDVALCYVRGDQRFHLMDDPYMLSTPFEIEYEYDYFLSYPPEGKLDFPYTLTEPAPADVADYFEAHFEAEYDDNTREYLHLYNLSVLGNTFTFSMNTGGSNFVNYKPDGYTAYEEMICRKHVHLIAAVYDTVTGDILSVEKWGQHTESKHVFTDVRLTLPDFYDYDRHQVVLFRYELDFYPDGDYSRPSDVPKVSTKWELYVDPQEYIFGDANGDQKVNLTDVTMMLKYLAKWSSVKVSYPVYVTDIPECGFQKEDCFYNLPMVSATLKLIAGWNDVELSSYDLASCSAADYWRSY